MFEIIAVVSGEAWTGIAVAFLGTASAFIAARMEAKRRSAREETDDDKNIREELRDDKKELREEIKELKEERDQNREYILRLERELRAVYLERGNRQAADRVLSESEIVLPLVDRNSKEG